MSGISKSTENKDGDPNMVINNPSVATGVVTSSSSSENDKVKVLQHADLTSEGASTGGYTAAAGSVNYQTKIQTKTNINQRFKVKDFNDIISCRLCYGYLINPVTIDNCVHSFCRSCIVKYLGKNNNCPICRSSGVQINLSNLKSDALLKSLVYKIVPGLYQNEIQRQVQFNNANKNEDEIMDETVTCNFEEDFFSPNEPISLSLEYHPHSLHTYDEQNIPSIRYLQCPAAVTVFLLKKFICTKFDIDPKNPKISVEIIYEDEILPEDFSLMDVGYCYCWKRAAPMRFFYRIFIHKMCNKTIYQIDNSELSGCKNSNLEANYLKGSTVEEAKHIKNNNNNNHSILSPEKEHKTGIEKYEKITPSSIKTTTTNNNNNNVIKTNNFKSLRSNDIHFMATSTSKISEIDQQKRKSPVKKCAIDSLKSIAMVSIPQSNSSDDSSSTENVSLAQLKTARKKIKLSTTVPVTTTTTTTATTTNVVIKNELMPPNSSNNGNLKIQTKQEQKPSVPKLKIELCSLKTKITIPKNTSEKTTDTYKSTKIKDRQKKQCDETPPEISFPVTNQVDLATYAKNIGLLPIQHKNSNTNEKYNISSSSTSDNTKISPEDSSHSSTSASSSPSASSPRSGNVFSLDSGHSLSSSHKKRKKNKHSKESKEFGGSSSKRRKLHAEIASNPTDESLKLKVKITDNHKSHRIEKRAKSNDGKNDTIISHSSTAGNTTSSVKKSEIVVTTSNNQEVGQSINSLSPSAVSQISANQKVNEKEVRTAIPKSSKESSNSSNNDDDDVIIVSPLTTASPTSTTNPITKQLKTSNVANIQNIKVSTSTPTLPTSSTTTTSTHSLVAVTQSDNQSKYQQPLASINQKETIKSSLSSSLPPSLFKTIPLSLRTIAKPQQTKATYQTDVKVSSSSDARNIAIAQLDRLTAKISPTPGSQIHFAIPSVPPKKIKRSMSLDGRSATFGKQKLPPASLHLTKVSSNKITSSSIHKEYYQSQQQQLQQQQQQQLQQQQQQQQLQQQQQQQQLQQQQQREKASSIEMISTASSKTTRPPPPSIPLVKLKFQKPIASMVTSSNAVAEVMQSTNQNMEKKLNSIIDNQESLSSPTSATTSKLDEKLPNTSSKDDKSSSKDEKISLKNDKASSNSDKISTKNENVYKSTQVFKASSIVLDLSDKSRNSSQEKSNLISNSPPHSTKTSILEATVNKLKQQQTRTVSTTKLTSVEDFKSAVKCVLERSQTNTATTATTTNSCSNNSILEGNQSSLRNIRIKSLNSETLSSSTHTQRTYTAPNTTTLNLSHFINTASSSASTTTTTQKLPSTTTATKFQETGKNYGNLSTVRKQNASIRNIPNPSALALRSHLDSSPVTGSVEKISTSTTTVTGTINTTSTTTTATTMANTVKQVTMTKAITNPTTVTNTKSSSLSPVVVTKTSEKSREIPALLPKESFLKGNFSSPTKTTTTDARLNTKTPTTISAKVGKLSDCIKTLYKNSTTLKLLNSTTTAKVTATTTTTLTATTAEQTEKTGNTMPTTTASTTLSTVSSNPSSNVPTSQQTANNLDEKKFLDTV